MRYIVLLLFFLTIFSAYPQNKEKLVRKGNKQYKEGKYKEAEINYLKSLENNPQYYKGLFNLGDAYYKQKNYEEATKIFQNLSQQKTDKKTKAQVYHNLGNSLLQLKKYKESIDAYKNALRNNPNDLDTKYNLAYAQKMLIKQQQNQDNNKNKDKQNQQNQNNNKQNQDQQQKEQQKEQEKQEQQQKQQEMSKENAERMLEAMKNDEKNIIDKLQKQKQAVSIYIEKDW